jgi:hypothetical protein
MANRLRHGFLAYYMSVSTLTYLGTTLPHTSIYIQREDVRIKTSVFAPFVAVCMTPQVLGGVIEMVLDESEIQSRRVIRTLRNM